ncbi:hypothetical protein Tco_0782705, partial [Tanacetum coccineum]
YDDETKRRPTDEHSCFKEARSDAHCMYLRMQMNQKKVFKETKNGAYQQLKFLPKDYQKSEENGCSIKKIALIKFLKPPWLSMRKFLQKWRFPRTISKIFLRMVEKASETQSIRILQLSFLTRGNLCQTWTSRSI